MRGHLDGVAVKPISTTWLLSLLANDVALIRKESNSMPDRNDSSVANRSWMAATPNVLLEHGK